MSLADRVSAYNRARKWNIFLKTVDPQPEHTILDVGFNAQEYSPVDNYLERNYPYQERITALGIEDSREFEKRYPKVKAVVYDGKTFPFEDKSFDICWSNAVIEHVGNRYDQLFFLKEIARVSRFAFITTPNRNFPIELHTRTPLLHLMLPRRLFEAYLVCIRKRWATRDYMNLLAIRDIRQLLSEAEIDDYRIVSNRLCGFVMDFIVMFGEI